MSPVPDPSARFHLPEGWTAAAVVIFSTLYHAPALAQAGNRIGISGYVAARCWAAVPAAGRVRQQAGHWMIDGPAAARCSQGAMALTISVAKPAARAVPEPAPASGQTAREGVAIVVSPTV